MDKTIKFLEKNRIMLSATQECCDFIEDYLEGYVEFTNEHYTEEGDSIFINVINKKHSDILEVDYKDYVNLPIHYDQNALLRRHNNKNEVIFLGKNHKIYLSKRQITILLNEDDNKKNYIPMRIIREIYKLYLLSNEYEEYHASSVQLKDKGIVFIGDKGAGKTTNMLLSIAKYNADFISNDKTFINVKSSMFFGFPMALNIKKDIINIFPFFKKIFENPKHYQHTNWSEFKHKEKFTFNIKEILNVTDSNLVSKSSLDYLILLSDKKINKYENLSLNSIHSLIKKHQKSTDFYEWEQLIKETLPIKQSNDVNNVENSCTVITTSKCYVDDILNEIKKGVI